MLLAPDCRRRQNSRGGGPSVTASLKSAAAAKVMQTSLPSNLHYPEVNLSWRMIGSCYHV